MAFIFENRALSLLKSFISFSFAVFFFLCSSIPVYAISLYRPGEHGYDISFPQCSTPYPKKPYAFIIVGVTNGKAFTQNPCLFNEFFWARRTRANTSVYMNLNFPSGASVRLGNIGPQGACRKDDMECQAYNYGYNAAENAYHYAASKLVFSVIWWLDIELANTWSDNIEMNRQVLEGAVNFFSSVSVKVGVYSIPSDWKAIAGSNFVPTQRVLFPLPNWVVGNGDPSSADFYCLYPFTLTGKVAIVQNTPNDFDQDYICP